MYAGVSKIEFDTKVGPRKGMQAIRDVVVFMENVVDQGGGNVTDLGIYNRRAIRGKARLTWKTASLHAVGRAWDIGWTAGFDAKKLAGRLAIVGELVGIQEVIFNRQRWTPGLGWRPYTGVDPHTTHIHVSVTVDWADNVSSFDEMKKWASHFLYQTAA